MKRSLLSRWWYAFIRVVLWTLAIFAFRVRCHGRARLPKSGGYLLLSNHQSFLDPPLVGMVIPQRINFLARQSLFKNSLFGAFLHSLDTIPLDRDGMGIAGLKETLRRLKRGEIVLIFPEGTRSADGEMLPLKAGFSALAQRSNVPLVPIAIDGAYEAFPRSAKWPRLAVIHLCVGEPISPETANRLEDPALVALVSERLHACQDVARRQRRLALNDG